MMMKRCMSVLMVCMLALTGLPTVFGEGEQPSRLLSSQISHPLVNSTYAMGGGTITTETEEQLEAYTEEYLTLDTNAFAEKIISMTPDGVMHVGQDVKRPDYELVIARMGMLYQKFRPNDERLCEKIRLALLIAACEYDEIKRNPQGRDDGFYGMAYRIPIHLAIGYDATYAYEGYTLEDRQLIEGYFKEICQLYYEDYNVPGARTNLKILKGM